MKKIKELSSDYSSEFEMDYEKFNRYLHTEEVASDLIFSYPEDIDRELKKEIYDVLELFPVNHQILSYVRIFPKEVGGGSGLLEPDLFQNLTENWHHYLTVASITKFFIIPIGSKILDKLGDKVFDSILKMFTKMKEKEDKEKNDDRFAVIRPVNDYINVVYIFNSNLNPRERLEAFKRIDLHFNNLTLKELNYGLKYMYDRKDKKWCVL